jgi:hypothetical protein
MLGLEIRGLQALQAKAAQMIEDLHGRPMLDGMRRATMLVSKDAKILSPVDTGLLRSSITPDVELEGFTVLGIVGSNVFYAPYQETGTSRGLKGKRYLQGAFEKNLTEIKKLIGDVVARIVDK